MIGNWAGELGPTQFTPRDYFKHGVDFDGDGRVDMIRSVPDALASAANLLKSFGWQTRPSAWPPPVPPTGSTRCSPRSWSSSAAGS